MLVYFSEIQYGVKSQNGFLPVCKRLGGYEIFCLLLCSVMAWTDTVGLIMRMRV